MRVIAGEFRGRLLKAVPSKETRPTTDRVREAWASTLENLLPSGLQGVVVLDAFAGSGALGIEALSRGALRVVFAEYSRKALSALKDNLNSLELDDASCSMVLRADTLKPGAHEAFRFYGPYDVIILDPPYALSRNAVSQLLAALADTGALATGCVISYEQASANRLDDNALAAWLEGIATPPGASYVLATRKTYGTVALDYLRYVLSPHSNRED